jgi:hypothetical protein
MHDREHRTSPLAGLRRLEQRYDGPIPADALAALDASPATLAARRRAADSALVDRLSRDAMRGRTAAELAAIRGLGLGLRG